MTGYSSFDRLQANEQEGVDYCIQQRRGDSGLLVTAPHGGGIEPGTGDIADAVAGREHAFYCFRGTKPSGNRILHIASNHFDEPLAERMLRAAQWVLAVHGCRGEAPAILVGGRDSDRGGKMIQALRKANFAARCCERPGLRGLDPNNLCNRGRSGAGVQLEISLGLRRLLFADLQARPTRKPTALFHRLVSVLRFSLQA